MLAITYEDMCNQLRAIFRYYFFDSDFQNNVLNPTLDKIAFENPYKYAKKHEEATDNFIWELASLVDGNRDDSIKLINNASDELIATLYVRLMIFTEFCEDNPKKTYILLSDNNKQLVIECLINFWRLYCHEGSIDFLA